MIIELPEAGSLSALIFSLSWFLLSNTHVAMKALGFSLVFPTEQAILDLVVLCPFHFAEGLLDVVQAAAPPTIAYFKSLPLILGAWWAIYVLVLEKAGERAKIYIGSGSEFTKGYLKRMEAYDKRMENGTHASAMPSGVERALNDGYEITHKATLAWTPIPLPFEKSALTGLLLLLECFFTVCF